MNRTGSNGPKTKRLLDWLATHPAPEAPVSFVISPKPLIPEVYLNRRGVVWLKGDDEKLHSHYEGDLHVGQVFAWEPDIPTARELVIICSITERELDERAIWTLSLDSVMRGQRERWEKAMRHVARSMFAGAPVWNDESRFREAVTPTLFNDQLP